MKQKIVNTFIKHQEFAVTTIINLTWCLNYIKTLYHKRSNRLVNISHKIQTRLYEASRTNNYKVKNVLESKSGLGGEVKSGS